MDWARDDAGLSDEDLENVFMYDPKPTTVIKMVESTGYQPQIWTLHGDEAWIDWIGDQIQTMRSDECGFVLVLSNRRGAHNMETSESMGVDSWLNSAARHMSRTSQVRREHTFSQLEEKPETSSKVDESGGRSLRTLPFSLETYKLITRSLCTHGSIARVISRADVPTFSSESVVMSEPAYIYNCRTSNAWPEDLALSSTYLPGSGVSFSIMYGCSFAIEQNIIGRLKYIASEAAHPLLLPGILVELELSRHIKLIESTINKVEAKIFELDFDYANLGRPKSDVDDRNEEKREAWLDLTYLRNGLISWNTQIGRMHEHVDELKQHVFNLSEWRISDCSGKDCMVSALRNWSKHSDGTMPKAIGPLKKPTWDVSKPKVRFRKTPEVYKRDMQQVGERIKARLSAIRDEYDEKIRDCTMRVDGMAMATQWSHGETNVEIALATNQDSKVMRSIALVTMVFLPGTFFGTVFSMTFFNWSGDGKARISSYLWIYVVITVVFTLMTVGLWYFLVVYRKKRSTAESGNSA